MEGEWLADHLDPRVQAALMYDRITRIAGREKYLHSRPPAHGLVSELTAVHSAWHDDIREQEINIVSAVDDLERGRGIGGGEDAVAQIIQDLDRVSAKRIVVLDDENAV